MRFISIYTDVNPAKRKGTIIASMGLPLLCATAMAVILRFSSDDIAQLLFRKPALAEVLHLFAYGLPFTVLMTIISSLLQGSHVMKYSVTVRDLIQPSANVLLLGIFFYASYTLSGAIVAYILSQLVACAFGLKYSLNLFPELGQREVRPVFEVGKLLCYSLPLLFVGFLQYLLAWTDVLMLGVMGATKEVGIYRAASEVPFVMTLFLFATNSIYAPLSAKLHEDGETERLSKILKITTRWVIMATVPIFLFLVFSSREVMSLFGTEYVESGSIVLIVLATGQLVNCATGGVGLTLTMTGKQNIELVNSLCSLLLNVLLNFILIPLYGVLGVAISSSAAQVSVNVLRAMQVRRIYAMNAYSRKSLEIGIPAAIAGAFLFLANPLIPPKFKLLGHLAIIIFNFGLWFYFSKLSEEARYLAAKIKSCIIGTRV